MSRLCKPARAASAASRPSPLAPWSEDAGWTARAWALSAFLCDAVFRIADTFYVGKENDFTQREWEEARVPLRPPTLPCRIPGRVATVDLLGRENELVTYYEQIIAIAHAHGKVSSLRHPFPYFSVGPTIIGGGEMLACFPWSDDMHDTRSVLEALAGSGKGLSGEIWDDQDQGWQIRIIASGDVSCFVEWDAEGPPPVDSGWSVDAATLARQAAEALARLETIHDRLVRALGQDYWLHTRAG